MPFSEWWTKAYFIDWALRHRFELPWLEDATKEGYVPFRITSDLYEKFNTAKEKPAEGEIVSVGTGARDEAGNKIAMDVKKGDKVLFGKWSGTEVKIDDEDMLIMKESDILGIIA